MKRFEVFLGAELQGRGIQIGLDSSFHSAAIILVLNLQFVYSLALPAADGRAADNAKNKFLSRKVSAKAWKDGSLFS